MPVELSLFRPQSASSLPHGDKLDAPRAIAALDALETLLEESES